MKASIGKHWLSARDLEGCPIVCPEESARAAACRMKALHVGFLVVVEEGKPIGMITDRDLALGVLRERKDPATCCVSEFITAPVVTVGSGVLASEASRVMRTHSIRKLPVVDGEGCLVGVLTADDLVVSLADRIQKLAETVKRERSNEMRPAEHGSKFFGRE